ncbi:hypothetical protein [Sphaerothrix gracilis]|uniref:hypothetical protein n=1 Tax=Sphaerothrix gracilis TaxID=3151835 RepID=UPI0031FDA2D1
MAQLWKSDNSIAAFLSRFLLPPNIDTETFLRRVKGVPKNVTSEAVVIAVFLTAREELSAERVQEISSILPDGLQVLWDQI